MRYELIITEKPAAAKKIADALADGKAIKESKAGVPYYKVTHGKKDIVVACAVGHLFTVGEKEKKAWSYPVFKCEWKASSDDRKESAYTKKYLTTIKSLAKEAKEYTVATDYDIEGEVIGLNIVRYACRQKDAARMKFSTLTAPDLIKAYEKKSPTLDWGQANAGETRHILDWLYGINISRALTLSIKNATGMFKILSSGRVQGPALQILVQKEKDIKAFVPEPFWQLELQGNIHAKDIIALHIRDKFKDHEEVKSIHEKCRGKRAFVDNMEKRQFNQNPPFPFDLTSLQIEAFRTTGIAPKDIMAIAQDLYIAGSISYPRTSSQKLPKELGFENIMKHLAKQPEYKQLCGELLKKQALRPNEGPKSDPAHPAIYPTGVMPKLTDSRKKRIYDLVVRRFLATFAEPAVRETVTADIGIEQELFRTSGTRTIVKGWHTYYGSFATFKEEELPDMKKGEEVTVRKLHILDKETQPPKRYTASSIIKELEKRNLGTKATRASIVDALYQRGYVNDKSIEATELGIRTCQALEKYCPDILDEALTRHFEEEMEDIRQAKKTEKEVIDEAIVVLTKIFDKFKKQEKQIGKDLADAFMETRDEMNLIGKCPNCEDGNLQMRKGKFGMFIACNKYPDCKTTYSLPSAMVKPTKDICEHCKLPMVLIIKKRKQPQKICINSKCPSKIGDYTKEQRHEMDQVEKGHMKKKCPKCKEGSMVVRKSIYGSFFGCNKYPKCRYTERLTENRKDPVE